MTGQESGLSDKALLGTNRGVVFTCIYCGTGCPGIGFGSCADRMEKSSAIWDAAQKRDPPKIIWMGNPR